MSLVPAGGIEAIAKLLADGPLIQQPSSSWLVSMFSNGASAAEPTPGGICDEATLVVLVASVPAIDERIAALSEVLRPYFDARDEGSGLTVLDTLASFIGSHRANCRELGAALQYWNRRKRTLTKPSPSPTARQQGVIDGWNAWLAELEAHAASLSKMAAVIEATLRARHKRPSDDADNEAPRKHVSAAAASTDEAALPADDGLPSAGLQIE